jgi:hypothetical protein
MLVINLNERKKNVTTGPTKSLKSNHEAQNNVLYFLTQQPPSDPGPTRQTHLLSLSHSSLSFLLFFIFYN